MGDLFRRYWLPALLAEELPEVDCPPVRVKILGERLIAFRDTQNRLGLVDEFCAHRGVSLWFGRNEENGLRCSYHGWKYDVTGQCVEIPSEPDNAKLCQRIERGGVLWTYMGPQDARPPLPEHEWAMVPAANRFVSKRWQECNWLQAMEGGIDSSHVSFLHRHTMKVDPMFKAATQSHKYNLGDLAPHFEVVESPGGLYIGARRNAENDKYYWRITQWIMPSFTLIPPRGDHPIGGHSWVPMDDENCWAWSTNHHATRALTQEEREAMIAGKGIHVPLIPGTFRPLANKDNDYLMDRQEGRPHILRRRRLRHAGRVGAGEHGADPRPHAREPRADRPGNHHGAPAADQGGSRTGQRNSAARRRSEAHPCSFGVGAPAKERRLSRSSRRRTPTRARLRARHSLKLGTVPIFRK